MCQQVVAQGTFQLRGDKPVVSVSGVEAPRSSNVEEFEDMVRKDLVGVSPTYILPLMKKSLPPPSAIPFLSTCGASPSLLNKWCYTSRPTVPYLLSPPPFMFIAPETPLMEGEAQCTGTRGKKGRAVDNLSMLTSY